MKIKNIITILLVAFILASCAPMAKVVPTNTTVTAPIESTLTPESTIESPTLFSWKTYTSETFLITLKYPAYWNVNEEGYAVFSGQDGFFQITASSIAAPTAKEWCELIMQNSLGKNIYRYGTKPTMEVLKVDNQPACLILPSDDQPQGEHDSSFLVVEYPQVEGERTRLLFFWADKNHIRDFISVLKFVR